MQARYHRQITAEALAAYVSPAALETIIAANLGQDSPVGLVWHPEYHYDGGAFAASEAYVARQRQTALSRLAAPNGQTAAWRALGRLAHAVQDFYAHSNYVALWLEAQPEPHLPPAAIQPLDRQVLDNPKLHWGRVYYLRDALSYIPPLKPLALRWLPRDAHAWMNLDHPGRGPHYPYAHAAARQRTVLEIQQLLAGLTPEQASLLCG
jgi:hypothetical protein